MQQRVEPVGSLVRPAWLEGAELARSRGRLEAEPLRALQDRAVIEALARQEAAGLGTVTDGELRRMPLLAASTKGAESWHRGWARHILPGIHDEALDLVRADRFSKDRAEAGTVVLEAETEEPGLLGAVDEYRFAAAHTRAPIKISLLGPERAAQGLASAIDRSLYTDFDTLVGEVVRTERSVIGELVEAGCNHVQLDVPGYAAYEDPMSWAALRGHGVDPLADLQLAVQADNAVIDGIDGLTSALHICRRGSHGRWQRAVTNDAVAETMLSQLTFDRLLIDYGEAAPSFDSLRFVPRHTTVVLGLVSTTDARVETVDDLVRRVEEATAHLDEDQLAIGPQCGFAGPVGHHDVSEDTQWRKFDALVATAERLWG